MNPWAFFKHRAIAVEDMQRGRESFRQFLAEQNENVDAHLKDFCATAFPTTRMQEGVNCAMRVLSGEK